MGGLALKQAGDVNRSAAQMCPKSPMVCPSATLQAGKSAAMTKALVADIGFGVGVAGAATGAVLCFLGLPKASQAVQGATGPEGITLRF